MAVVAMKLTTWDKQLLVIRDVRFREFAPSECPEMVEHEEYVLCYLQLVSAFMAETYVCNC